MAANRIIDRQHRRAEPAYRRTGSWSPGRCRVRTAVDRRASSRWWCFLAAAALLNWLCLALAPLAVVPLVVYPYAQAVHRLPARRSSALAQAVAPIGAWIGGHRTLVVAGGACSGSAVGHLDRRLRPASTLVAAAASSRMPSSQMRSRSLALGGGEHLEPERRLERDDGRVDPDAVEQREPRLELVIAEVDLVRALAEAQGAPSRKGAVSALRERLDEGARPEVLVDVDARHRQAQILPERISSTSGSRSGSDVALVEERDEPAHGLAQPASCPVPSSRPAEIARLRREHQLDRDDPRAELDHLLEPPGGERRHRHPVLDPLGLRRRDELERDGLREEPRLDGDRLDRDPELAERALGHRGALRRGPR